jgi:GrpB-like predicted nucleotidyltransferase (UPF0157 family)
MSTSVAPGAGGRESSGMRLGAGRPVIAAYQPGWPQRAATLIAALRGHLGVLAGRIEHIGSTAIPGMDAKDVLDLQVSVTGLDAAARAFDEPLGVLGFHPAVYARDHVPAGQAGDPGQWAKIFWSRRAHPGGDVNLHARVAGSANERLALLFRDWFRAHPEAIPAYATFKRSLAAVTPDPDAYSDVKDPVIDLVITVAETWAASAGWQP